VNESFPNLPNDDARPWLSAEYASPEGIVGVGGELTVPILLDAYSSGVFPWFNEDDPVIWWCPDPRAVIPFDGVHVSKSLKRTLTSGLFRYTLNTCFEDVIRQCRVLRTDEGTWITEEVIQAYCQLHRQGHAHSLEVWDKTDALVGGIYGVAIGGFFAGESMFYTATNASKCALVWLLTHLRSRGYRLFDTQIINHHTARFGAIEIPRGQYLVQLHSALATTPVTFQ